MDATIFFLLERRISTLGRFQIRGITLLVAEVEQYYRFFIVFRVRTLVFVVADLFFGKI